MDPKRLCLRCMNPKTNAAVCPFCGCAAGNRRAHPQDMEPGVRLKDRYLIGSSLRSTDYTITYSAYDLSRDKKIAVTEYFPIDRAARGMNGVSVITCPVEMPYSLREQAAATEDSGFPAFAVFEENGTVYAVTDAAGGTSLEEILRVTGGRISFEQAIRIFLPVMHAVEAIHAADTAYGRLDAAHILVTEDGKGLPVGFGEILLHALGSRMDAGIGGRKSGQSADIRQLAAVMFQVLSGSAPSDISGPDAAERPLVYDVYGFKIPVSIENAISRAMDPDAASPFASMREFESACTADTRHEKAVRQNSRVKARKIFLPFGR